MTTLATDLAFDAYSDSFRDDEIFVIKTGPTVAPWKIERHPLHRTMMQFGSDGGARIVHGIARSGTATVLIQLIKGANDVLFDGQIVRWHDLAVIAPGGRFTFAATTPTRWLALSVPPALLIEPLAPRQRARFFQERNTVVGLSEISAAQIIAAARRSRADIRKAARLAANADAAAIETAFLNILTVALADRATRMRPPGRHQHVFEGNISKALEYVRARTSENIHVSDLAGAAGTSTRALFRAFKSYLRMGTKDYLKYRQLNMVRRALRLDQTPVGLRNPVTAVMSTYGVTEFGRFAAEYRRLFAEFPSDTFGRRGKKGKSGDSGCPPEHTPRHSA